MSSFPTDQRPLVIDTSVLINLHACTSGEQILSSIPNEIIVAQLVGEELNHETSRKNGEQSFLQSLEAKGIVVQSDLTDEEYEIFSQLISDSGSIDDGEAATIAIAATRHFFPVIDDKKGRARASAIMAMEPGWSIDLLRHPLVISVLGDKVALEALYLALRNGRMRIPPESADDIIALIGMDRAIECTCLPGYRERFKKLD